MTSKIEATLAEFTPLYREAAHSNGYSDQEIDALLHRFTKEVAKQIASPHHFTSYHKKLPDYYHFGLDFIRPLIDLPRSTIHREDLFDEIDAHLSQGDNAIFFTNHQTEPDPQIISILLEKKYPKLATDMIFVAGHLVTTDPLAIPFSLGRNLLCIWSKKHIDSPPEQRPDKLRHNQKTMQTMQGLLAEGGKAIFVAPSGGRDRIGPSGQPEVAHFDPNSIEMFRLMAQKAKRITHFYPLTLDTYTLLPPPQTLHQETGEKRTPRCTPVHLAVGEEISMDNFHRDEPIDKHHARKLRANHIWHLVCKDYEHLTHH